MGTDIQSQRSISDGAQVEVAKLHEQIQALSYPLHFIDFKTSRPTLPFHAGHRPYEQLLFQFSHRRLDADGSLWVGTRHLPQQA